MGSFTVTVCLPPPNATADEVPFISNECDYRIIHLEKLTQNPCYSLADGEKLKKNQKKSVEDRPGMERQEYR